MTLIQRLHVFTQEESLGASEALQIGKATSFIPNSLSVPSSQNGCQVFLHGHLLSIAAVAVGEDAIRMPLG